MTTLEIKDLYVSVAADTEADEIPPMRRHEFLRPEGEPRVLDGGINEHRPEHRRCWRD